MGANTNMGSFEKGFGAFRDRMALLRYNSEIYRFLENPMALSAAQFSIRDWFFPAQDGSGNPHHRSRRTKTWLRSR